MGGGGGGGEEGVYYVFCFFLLIGKSCPRKKVRKTHLKSEKLVFLLVFVTFGCQIIHFSDFDVSDIHV